MIIVDLFRAFALCVYLFDGIWALAIFHRWVRQVPEGRRALLHRHVTLVSVFTILAMFTFAGDTLGQIGQPFKWWITPTALVASLALAAGLWNLARWVAYRARAVDLPGDPPAGRRREDAFQPATADARRSMGHPLLFVIAMMTIVAVGWGDDKRSCVREQAVRRAAQARADYERQTGLSLIADARYRPRAVAANETQSGYRLIALARVEKVPALACSRLVPGT